MPEQEYRNFNVLMKDKKLDNILLIAGEEEYLADFARNSFIKTYLKNEAELAFGLEELDGNEINIEELKNALKTPTFFGELKIVVYSEFSKKHDVELVKQFKEVCKNDNNKKNVSKKKTAAVRTVLGIQDDIILVLSARGDVKDFNICDWIQAFNFGKLSRRDVAGFIDKQIRSRGKAADRFLIGEIINKSGYMERNRHYYLYNLENDIKKMTAYTQGNSLSEKSIDAGISENPETGVWMMADEASRGRYSSALRLLYDLLLTGEAVESLLGIITKQIENIFQVKELHEKGMNLRQICEKIGGNSYPIEKAFNFSKRYSLSKIRQILKRAYETEVYYKTGMLDKEIALELLVLEFSVQK